MKVQKVMISIFLKDEKVIRISLDKIFIILILLIFLMPYGILSFKWLRHSNQSTEVITVASHEQKTIDHQNIESTKQILPDLAPTKGINKAHPPKIKAPIVKAPVAKTPEVAFEDTKPTEVSDADIKPVENTAPESISTNPYLITNLQMYAIGRDLSIDFVLTKKKLDNKMSAGSVFVEVIDKNQNAVVVSGKTLFKFSMARPSKFYLNVPIQYKADKIKIHITDAYSDNQNRVLEYPIPSTTEL